MSGASVEHASQVPSPCWYYQLCKTPSDVAVCDWKFNFFIWMKYMKIYCGLSDKTVSIESKCIDD
jgi:hypothetical protein